MPTPCEICGDPTDDKFCESCVVKMVIASAELGTTIINPDAVRYPEGDAELEKFRSIK